MVFRLDMIYEPGPNLGPFKRVLDESGMSRLESSKLTAKEHKAYRFYLYRPFNIGACLLMCPEMWS